jgi:hypothetical protein
MSTTPPGRITMSTTAPPPMTRRKDFNAVVA